MVAPAHHADKQHIDQSRATVVMTVITWISLNVAMNNVNKWVFYREEFHFPFCLTLCHMLCCHLLSALYLWLRQPASASSTATPAGAIRNARVLGGVFCVGLAAGNVALRWLHVSFTQILGSTTPLVTVLLLRAFCGRSYSWRVYVSLVPIVVGACMSTKGELEFHTLGFAAALLSVLARGIKSILSEILLSGGGDSGDGADAEAGKLDAVTLLYYMSQTSAPMLLTVVAVVELPSLRLEPSARSTTAWASVAASAVIAFLVNVVNFLVVQQTSAVTLQVLGSAKGVLVILLSVWLFGNRVSLLSAAGCAVTLSGVALYNASKHLEQKGLGGETAATTRGEKSAAAMVAVVPPPGSTSLSLNHDVDVEAADVHRRRELLEQPRLGAADASPDSPPAEGLSAVGGGER